MNEKTELYRGFTITCETPEQRKAYQAMIDRHFATSTGQKSERPDLSKLCGQVIVPAPDDAEAINHHNAQRSARCTDQPGGPSSLSLVVRTACSMSAVVFMQGVMRNQPPYGL